jgi:hypothetical protein
MFLLLALSCSNPQPTTAPAPPATIAPAPKAEKWPPPGWTPSTNAEAAKLQARIAKQMNGVATTASQHDPVLGAELKQMINDFKGLTPVVMIDNDSSGNPIFLPYDCPQDCDHFLAADTPVVAIWDNTRRDLVFDLEVVNDNYTPFVGFHELYHRRELREHRDFMASEIVPGTTNPAETDAWNFQSRVTDAATGGRYSTLIKGWAMGVQRGLIPSVATSDVTIAAIPDDLKPLFNGGEGNSDLSLQGLNTLFEYDLNRELILQSKLTQEEKTHELELVYNRVVASDQNPDAQTICRESMRSWRR